LDREITPLIFENVEHNSEVVERGIDPQGGKPLSLTPVTAVADVISAHFCENLIPYVNNSFKWNAINIDANS